VVRFGKKGKWVKAWDEGVGQGFLERRISNVNALRTKADNNNKNPRRNGE